jgi:glycosyltransferase involved in cell wall biosynthesis
MNPELKFSIIIPTYNRARFIQKTVASALDQGYRNFEVIVVDDGSTDNTAEVIRGIDSPKLKYVRITNSERGAARNHGIDLATGDYVTFLDSDDMLFGNYLSNAREKLVDNNYPAFFHQAYELRDQEMRVLYNRKVPKNDIQFLIKGNDLSCLGIFIRRDLTGKFRFNEDRNLSGSEDWELWLSISANFGLCSDSTVCSALIVHSARSVLSYDEHKLEMRKNLALKYAFKDPKVVEVFGKFRRRIEAYCDTYISLHLVLAGENKKGLRYLAHSFRSYPPSIIERRFFAIVKYTLMNWIGLR